MGMKAIDLTHGKLELEIDGDPLDANVRYEPPKICIEKLNNFVNTKTTPKEIWDKVLKSVNPQLFPERFKTESRIWINDLEHELVTYLQSIGAISLSPVSLDIYYTDEVKVYLLGMHLFCDDDELHGNRAATSKIVDTLIHYGVSADSGIDPNTTTKNWAKNYELRRENRRARKLEENNVEVRESKTKELKPAMIINDRTWGDSK